MPKENIFQIEYSKSNMATCRVCMAKIPKGVLRIGHLQTDADMDFAPAPASAAELENDATAPAAAARKEKDTQLSYVAGATRWHHFECFPNMKGAKWMAANLPPDPDSVQGLGALKKPDQKKLRSLWKALEKRKGTSSAAAGKKRKADGPASTEDAAAAKKTRTKAATKADTKISKLTAVQGVLKDKQFQKVQAFEEKLKPVTTAQLQAELALNDQVRNGKKPELVQRVAEGRVLGSLPRCPRCKKGRIHWSRIGGWYNCPGYYDGEDRMQKRCYFRAQELKRGPWKTKK
mmetsp:Transcript_71495/g.155295  ORF Transcript_71495/g.155295 Transcript_71495/m.155295 type:complete len:290 (-) Transcript_71495:310-1179(-)